jgi:hypothetical protein
MAVFHTTEQLYICTEALLTGIQEQDPAAADTILASHMIFRLRTTDPEAEITMNGRKRPLKISYGPAGLRPTMDIELTADTLHAILSGELSLRRALASGLLSVRGPVWKAQALADLFYQGRDLYPQILREQNLA